MEVQICVSVFGCVSIGSLSVKQMFFCPKGMKPSWIEMDVSLNLCERVCVCLCVFVFGLDRTNVFRQNVY